jgi:uncharacterized metal-binding protein YceD (DUF177 family)
MKKVILAPEFSYPIAVETIEAQPKECQKLAERFGLLELKNLKADTRIEFDRDEEVVVVTGTIYADVVQQCGVTLEPLPAHIESEFDIECVAEEEPSPASSNLITLDEENREPIIGGKIDLGEIVAQHLGTSIDPYPRKPGIAYVEAEYGAKAEVVIGPFAKLAELREKGKIKD